MLGYPLGQCDMPPMDGIERTEIENDVFHDSIGLAEKVAHDAFDLRHGRVQHVVDDDVVEFGRLGQFELRFGDPFGDHFGSIGAAELSRRSSSSIDGGMMKTEQASAPKMRLRLIPPSTSTSNRMVCPFPQMRSSSLRSVP